MKNHHLVFSAICTALGTIFLMAGFYLGAAQSFWVFLASLCIMLSLETGKLKSGIITYFAVLILSLIFNGFNLIMLIPYVSFMGICPIVNEVCERLTLPSWLSYLLKQAMFTGSMLITAVFGSALFGIKLTDYKALLIIIALTLPVFFFYNLGMVNIRRRLRQFFSKAKVI